MNFAIARGRQGTEGAAVKAVLGGDDMRLRYAFVIAVFAGNFDGGFVRFSARIGKEGFVHPRERNKLCAQFLLAGDVIQIGGVQ